MFSILMLFYFATAHALDNHDVGKYAVIHKDGHVTNKIFRVVHSDTRWEIEDRKQNGEWDDVTCEKGCILMESKEKDIEYFMGGKAPAGMVAECIHNQAFAFCRITKEGDKNRRYLFIALTQHGPIPINLQRINENLP